MEGGLHFFLFGGGVENLCKANVGREREYMSQKRRCKMYVQAVAVAVYLACLSQTTPSLLFYSWFFFFVI